jgi:hypothetical protein
MREGMNKVWRNLCIVCFEWQLVWSSVGFVRSRLTSAFRPAVIFGAKFVRFAFVPVESLKVHVFVRRTRPWITLIDTGKRLVEADSVCVLSIPVLQVCRFAGELLLVGTTAAAYLYRAYSRGFILVAWNKYVYCPFTCCSSTILAITAYNCFIS